MEGRVQGAANTSEEEEVECKGSMVEVLGVRWVHALCPEVIARFLYLAAGGGVGARTEALGGGRGGTFWYWNGMLTACAGEERERTLPASRHWDAPWMDETRQKARR